MPKLVYSGVKYIRVGILYIGVLISAQRDRFRARVKRRVFLRSPAGTGGAGQCNLEERYLYIREPSRITRAGGEGREWRERVIIALDCCGFVRERARERERERERERGDVSAGV